MTQLREEIISVFPLVKSVRLRTRGTKQYLTIVFSETGNRFATGYDYLLLIKGWLVSQKGYSLHITSGGLSGGTFRLNPD